ncbi:MAG: hypothetical protein NC078_09465 [Ruminococcus sp.]|nr:hypothetical protein [Ruminococcus sp.]
MVIKPFTCLIDEHDEISEFCKSTNEPIFLTKNGEDDLVVMNIDAYSLREEMLDMRQKILEAEANRLNGAKTYTIDEFFQRAEDIINRAEWLENETE